MSDLSDEWSRPEMVPLFGRFSVICNRWNAYERRAVSVMKVIYRQNLILVCGLSIRQEALCILSLVSLSISGCSYLILKSSLDERAAGREKNCNKELRTRRWQQSLLNNFLRRKMMQRPSNMGLFLFQINTKSFCFFLQENN